MTKREFVKGYCRMYVNNEIDDDYFITIMALIKEHCELCAWDEDINTFLSDVMSML